MGFLDEIKDKGEGLKDKASELAAEHGDKLDAGIDKAADLADKATGGKFGDKIDQAAEAAKNAADRL